MFKDKNILITGGNSGIGFHATINLLKNNNNLYIPIRSELRKEQFFTKVQKYFDKSYLNKYINIIENIDLSDLENINTTIEKLGFRLQKRFPLRKSFIQSGKYSKKLGQVFDSYKYKVKKEEQEKLKELKS